MRGGRVGAAAAVVTVLALGAGATAQRLDSLAHVGPADFLDELVDVEVTLVLPARVTADRYVVGSLRIENKGPVTCVVPLDLRPGGGAVRIDWTGSAGLVGSRGRIAPDRRAPTVALAPGAFYGQRIHLAASEQEPCIRIGDHACNWNPGRYVFTATVEIGIDPAARPSEDTLPGLASRAFTTAPVVVEVAR